MPTLVCLATASEVHRGTEPDRFTALRCCPLRDERRTDDRSEEGQRPARSDAMMHGSISRVVVRGTPEPTCVTNIQGVRRSTNGFSPHTPNTTILPETRHARDIR